MELLGVYGIGDMIFHVCLRLLILVALVALICKLLRRGKKD